ncbi:protein of unknown function DUF797 [Beutenbergia cavernae DSM 12333]|uniref:Prokaryotic ubiquitin-like protein Pup n=1 Tax=Beutenbergia cavernae (strain ATCC BAA-8 / DSM 12333 / CCUG 43141 / JCM 11478 / NBRC 16432 / NCIMB 13614 / HKI 0122) TaxID=471853 RepID=C5BVA3_BEUC1|nr:ubiquitin-like protein Pup [Beutenbergia cavernae]ACQ80490.1 protein of unknown function DUF797 [Beutenbergia cavernae DSM 12333]
MAGQDQVRPTHPGGDDEQPPPPAAPAARASTEGVDELLSEIDDVLETNAESFVRGFVQKGGQ